MVAEFHVSFLVVIFVISCRFKISFDVLQNWQYLNLKFVTGFKQFLVFFFFF